MVPFLGTLNNRCRIITGTQQGTIILTTTHMEHRLLRLMSAKGQKPIERRSTASHGALQKLSPSTFKIFILFNQQPNEPLA